MGYLYTLLLQAALESLKNGNEVFEDLYVERGDEMNFRITTLVENSLGEHLNLKNEHGISFFVQSDRCNLLFDAGQTDAFIKNAAELGIDLSQTTHIVFSHGHYDHTGGFYSLVKQKTNQFNLYLSSYFFNKKYSFNGISYQYLGNNFDTQFLQQNGIVPNYVKAPVVEISPGVLVFSDFERTTDFEKVNSRFYYKENDAYVMDDFRDEIVVGLNSSSGLVILLGCSHPGVVNILSTIMKRTGKSIYAVIGGTHLVEADEYQLQKTLDYFKQIGIKLVGISHCTGQMAMLELKKWNDHFFLNCTGTSIEV